MLERIGKYELGERIGAGGHATVYLARDTLLDIPVAIKVMNKLVSSGLEHVESLRQEARTAATLANQNIAQVRDFIVEDDYACIVMEYVPDSLDRLIEREGNFTPTRSVELISQICNALSYAHSENIVHQDVKPHNILIDPNENVKVSDFGLSKPVENSSSDTMLQAGITGTPTYMPPEQFLDETVSDIRSDIYSLGVTMYEMLSGSPPFQGNFTDLFRKHTQDDIPEFAANLNISKELAAIVYKCLEKDPNSRYQNIDEIRFDLDNLPHSTFSSSNKKFTNSVIGILVTSGWVRLIVVVGLGASVIFLGLRTFDETDGIVLSDSSPVDPLSYIPAIPSLTPSKSPLGLSTPTPFPTHTPYPTYTPYPPTLIPTSTPLVPVFVISQIPLILPTITPTPTSTPTATPTLTPTPVPSSIPTAVPEPSNEPAIIVANGVPSIKERTDVRVEYRNIPWDKNSPVSIELWWVADTDDLGNGKRGKSYTSYRLVEENSGNFVIKAPNFQQGIGNYWIIARDKYRAPIVVSEIFEITKKSPDFTPTPIPEATPPPHGELIYGDIFNDFYSQSFGNIRKVGEEDDYWFFEAYEGQEITLRVNARPAELTPHRLDPEIVLISPDGTIHTAKHGGSSEGRDPYVAEIGTEEFPYRLAQTGKYKVIVKSEGATQDTLTGPYSIKLKIFPYTANNPSLSQIEDGGVYYGELSVSDSMSWTFQGMKGQFVSLAVEPNHSFIFFVPQVRLLDNAGKMKRAGDPGKFVSQRETRVIRGYELESSGTFKVKVEKEESLLSPPYRYKLCFHLGGSEKTYLSSQCASLR